MTKRFASVAALLLAGGCRMCASSCDYGPVVPGGPPLGLQRSGSNLNGGYSAVDPSPVDAVPQPVITPLPLETGPATAIPTPAPELGM
jgi:hypothetical protein